MQCWNTLLEDKNMWEGNGEKVVRVIKENWEEMSDSFQPHFINSCFNYACFLGNTELAMLIIKMGKDRGLNAYLGFLCALGQKRYQVMRHVIPTGVWSESYVDYLENVENWDLYLHYLRKYPESRNEEKIRLLEKEPWYILLKHRKLPVELVKMVRRYY